MSVSAAESYARQAQSKALTNEKLDLIAKAVIELAQAIGAIEQDVRQIKNS